MVHLGVAKAGRCKAVNLSSNLMRFIPLYSLICLDMLDMHSFPEVAPYA